MDIMIKKIGKSNGTIGWLAAGLQSGELYLMEGHAKNGGNHGLWLKDRDGKIIQCLALYNEHDLSAAECQEAQKYDPINPEGFHLLSTDACRRALMEIAQQWCDACNKIADAEQMPALRVVRVDVEGVANA